MKGNLLRIGLAAIVLLAAMLACGPASGAKMVSVTINNPPSGSVVAVGESVMIDSTATAEAGIDRIELTVNGEMVRRDSPPGGKPTTFRVSQLWTPAAEGRATISVIAFDVNGLSSETAMIDLQVVASAAEGGEATQVLLATTVPVEIVPTEPPVTTEAGCVLDVKLLSETIPDNATMDPGAAFVKTWTIQNEGSCDWTGVDLFFAEGTQMGGPGNVALPDVASGGETSVTMNMVAPASPGTYKGVWRFRTGKGEVFGKLWVLIVVPAPTDVPDDAPTAAPTDTIEPTLALVTPRLPTLPAGPLPYTQQVHERKSVSAGEKGELIVYCPTDSVLVGGGFGAPPTVLVYRNIPVSGNGWQVAVDNTSSSSVTIDAFANCLYQAGTSSSYETQNTAVLAGEIGTVTAPCPSDSVVTGGGWMIHPGTTLHLFRSLKGGNGWSVFAKNEGSEGRSLYATAVCLKGSGGATTQVQASTNIASGKLGVVDAQCTGSLMTGGGFSTNPNLFTYASAPSLSGSDKWNSQAINTSGSEATLTGHAVCLTSP
ncbi:MAG: NBR1-Ig-like domain-containing protein [Anaerolineae bacterium]